MILRRFVPAAWIATATLCLTVALPAASWKPITPEDLAATARLDPETGIEILLREVAVDDSSYDETSFRHYIRLKVFNARGVSELDKIELPETNDWRVVNISARVVRPDGSIVPIDSKSIYTTEVLKRGSFKVRVKAFTFPALETGCIVEYQYEELASGDAGGLSGVTLRFQQKYPTWIARFRLRPSSYILPQYELMTMSNNFGQPVPPPDVQGYFNFEQRDVPAIVDEPWMPPDDAVESWIRFYYRRAGASTDDYWASLASNTAEYLEKRTKPNKAIVAMAKELTAGAASDEERLGRLYDFCRTEITNVYSDTSGMTPEEISRMKENKTAADTLERRAGTGMDINMLFVSLASASGYTARPARAGDRSQRFFDERLTVGFGLPTLVAAVKVGIVWQFFDPASRYLPYGTLSWRCEGQGALICDRKGFAFALVGEPRAAESRAVRRATLEIDEEGTLWGRVVVEYSGHLGVGLKNKYDGETPEAAARMVKEEVHERLGTAEITDVVVANASDAIKPLTVSYTIRVAEYAERTGTRMIFQPAFFQKGQEPRFTQESRRLDIYTAFQFSEEDIISIGLPEGYVLEEAYAPKSGPTDGVIQHSVKISVSQSGRKLGYRRLYQLGRVYFDKARYPAIKALHDTIHASDQHALVIRRIEEAPASANPMVTP